MFLFIGIIICALLLWAFAHFGIKNYEYDHAESMLTAKLINHSVFILLTILLAVKFLK